MSGNTVEARDQVLIIFFWPAAFMSSMRLRRRSSTNGPFFADLLKRRLLPYPRLPRLRPRMMNLSDGLCLARAVAQRGHAPRRDRVTAGRGLALAAAVRVVDRVHGRTAHGRAHAAPASAAGLAAGDVGVIGVAQLAHRSATGEADTAQLTGRQAHDAVALFLGLQLGARAGAAHQLPAATRLQLDVVDRGARRDVLERQRVAGLDVGSGAGLDGVAHLEALRREDVALLAVGVVQESDARRAVRVVLDVRDLGRHAVLVALEIDDAVAPLVAAALVARRDAPVAVAAAVLLERRQQRTLRLAARDVLERIDRHGAAAGRGRLESLDAHYLPSKNSILSPGASCTTAFFQAEVRPRETPRRFGLGRILAVETPTTVTLKSWATAWAIMVLCASRCTWKVYRSWSICA